MLDRADTHAIRDAYIEGADRLKDEETKVLRMFYPEWKCLGKDGEPDEAVKTAYLYIDDIERNRKSWG